MGETVARKLAEAFLSLEKLLSASQEDLEAVDEIGERIAQSVLSHFRDEKNLQLVERLKAAGVQLEMDSPAENQSDKLSGRSFVISGVFQNHSRDELKNLIEENGGKNSSSISARTHYVVAGENMGPSKYEKAQKLGIPIITEEDFMEMLSS